jgi:hypothetical protein
LTPPATFRSPDQLLPDGAPNDLRRLVAYWIAKADGRPMPSFGEFDPVDVPWALSRLYVVRVIDGGADFVYRLAGEAINERHGLTLAGKRSSDLFPLEVTRQIFDRWRRIISEPAACYTDSEHPTNAGWRIRGRRVVLPLGIGEGPADHVLGMTIFDSPSEVPSAINDAGLSDVRWVRLRAVD